VAHDLRTPVTRLRATAESALRTGRTSDDYRDALGDVVDEAERVSGMLDALMDLAEAETGAMALHVDTIDLAAIVRDAADLYADVAEAKGVEVTADVPGAIEMRGDRNRLAQAVANLLDNAVKYTPSGGRVHVTAARRDGAADVVVEDTGIGMTAEELPRIWERLFRGDRSRSERGLGLGLSLVKAIAERHGGSVTAESQPGAGSRFTLRLPLDDGAAAPGRPT
jgi:signal transduction histidine kinase